MIRHDQRTTRQTHRYMVMSCIEILDGALRSLAYLLCTRPDRVDLRPRINAALDERLRLMRIRDAMLLSLRNPKHTQAHLNEEPRTHNEERSA